MRELGYLCFIALLLQGCIQFRRRPPQEQLDAESLPDIVVDRLERSDSEALDGSDVVDASDADVVDVLLDVSLMDRSDVQDVVLDVQPERPMGCETSNELFFEETVTIVPTEEILSDGRAPGTLSADGLRFANGAGFTVHEFGRNTLGEPFRLLRSGYTWAELGPVMSPDKLELWTGHGGEGMLFRLRRNTPNEPFGRAFAPESGLPLYGSTPFAMAAAHVSATSSPDRRYVVFESNRPSASDAAGPRSATQFRIYSAEFIDSSDTSQGVRSVREESALTAASARSVPQWLSDDGLVLLFVSNRLGTYDVFRTRRTTPNAAFGMPELVLQLSLEAQDEQGITFPSLATMRANGCRIEGLLHRTITVTRLQAYRVRACLGAPCS